VAEYVLSYPFRIDSVNRRAEVVWSDTDTYKAEQVKGFIRTVSGERDIFPRFGIEEPTFATFDTGKFFDDFTEFYTADQIEIDKVTLTDSGGVLTDVLVEFL
jgi:hypothetical protein